MGCRHRVGVALRACALLYSGSLSWTKLGDEAAALYHSFVAQEIEDRCRFSALVRPRERTAAQQCARA